MLKGAQLQSRESFLYGRFEVMMKPAYGSGVVSSFFMFNDLPMFQTSWAEIDFEFLGRNTNCVDTNLIKTVSGLTDKNINVHKHILNKRSEDVFWKLCIEWSPESIIWKINDEIIRTMNVVLSKHQKIMMNIWVGNSKWAGEFNDGMLPQQSLYKYVRYSKYENGRFVYVFQDDFKTLDEKVWYVANHSIGETMFVKDNVYIEYKNLVLTLA